MSIAQVRLKKKRVAWEELIKARKNHSIKMWCVVRDFNSIKYANERRCLSPNANYRSDIC